MSLGRRGRRHTTRTPYATTTTRSNDDDIRRGRRRRRRRRQDVTRTTTYDDDYDKTRLLRRTTTRTRTTTITTTSKQRRRTRRNDDDNPFNQWSSASLDCILQIHWGRQAHQDRQLHLAHTLLELHSLACRCRRKFLRHDDDDVQHWAWSKVLRLSSTVTMAHGSDQVQCLPWRQPMALVVARLR